MYYYRMANIDIKKSWLSDHPLISLVDTDNHNLKLGVFNVLSDFASDVGKNAQFVEELDKFYKDHIINDGFGLTINTNGKL